jgi:hypothetical protein
VNSARKVALVTGVLFIITIIASIPAQFILYAPVLNNADYIVSGADSRVQWGAFLEMITALACIGTIVVGIASVLSGVTLRQDLAGAGGADPASLLTAGKSLVAFHDATFLLGPGILAGLGNGALLGYLMYTSGLVPRHMALLGLVGGPLVSASGIAMLLGLYEPVSVWAAIATVPEFFWELLLGIWLIVKGFKPSAIVFEPDTTDLKAKGEKSLARA